jgi:hypothetical protein
LKKKPGLEIVSEWSGTQLRIPEADCPDGLLPGSLVPIQVPRISEQPPLGHWGVKSYEVDEAADALDAGFEQVHRAHYEELMDDRNPLSYDLVQKQLANPDTLHSSIAALRKCVGENEESWGEVARLAFAGIVVRHAELGVSIPAALR